MPLHDAAVHVASLMSNHANDAERLEPRSALRADPLPEIVVRAVERDLILASEVSHIVLF